MLVCIPSMLEYYRKWSFEFLATCVISLNENIVVAAMFPLQNSFVTESYVFLWDKFTVKHCNCDSQFFVQLLAKVMENPLFLRLFLKFWLGEIYVFNSLKRFPIFSRFLFLRQVLLFKLCQAFQTCNVLKNTCYISKIIHNLKSIGI